MNREVVGEGYKKEWISSLKTRRLTKELPEKVDNFFYGWMDYKKAYDILSHSWILKCLEMVGEANNIITEVKNSMVT